LMVSISLLLCYNIRIFSHVLQASLVLCN
jgi:hypothetical protein